VGQGADIEHEGIKKREFQPGTVKGDFANFDAKVAKNLALKGKGVPGKIRKGHKVKKSKTEKKTTGEGKEIRWGG